MRLQRQPLRLHEGRETQSVPVAGTGLKVHLISRGRQGRDMATDDINVSIRGNRGIVDIDSKFAPRAEVHRKIDALIAALQKAKKL